MESYGERIFYNFIQFPKIMIWEKGARITRAIAYEPDITLRSF